MASPASRAGTSGNATILLYLSLFLLLLVFFIVLNAHSMPRDYRVKAVLGSVERSFAPPAEAGPRTPTPTNDGATAAARGGLQRLGDLFEAELGVVKVEHVGQGRMMVATMAASELFEGGSAFVRHERMGLLDRVARELGDRGGARLDMDFLIAVGGEAGGTAHTGDPVARAAAMARALVIDHAPADAIAVGLEPGEAGTARFLFSLHGPGEVRAGGAGGRRGVP